MILNKKSVIKYNFLYANKYLLFLYIIIFQVNLVSSGSRERAAHKQDIFSKTQQVLADTQNTETKYELLLDLVGQELADPKKAVALRRVLKKIKMRINKEPYSYVFAGYVLHQALFLKNLSIASALENFRYLHELIQKSKVFKRKKKIYLHTSTINSDYVKLYEFFLYQHIEFHIDGGIDNLFVMAAKEGAEQILKLSMKFGLDLTSEPSAYGITPLMHAASRGQISILKILMGDGATISTPDEMGRTALSYAIEWGQTKAVKLLLSQNARIDSDTLMCACYHGYDDILDILLNKCTDVDVLIFGNNTPLMILAKDGNKKMAKRVIRKGANVNALNNTGKSALFNAVICGHIHLAKLLLRKGAEIQLLNDDKNEQKNAILEVCTDQKSEMLELLKQHGLQI